MYTINQQGFDFPSKASNTRKSEKSCISRIGAMPPKMMIIIRTRY